MKIRLLRRPPLPWWQKILLPFGAVLLSILLSSLLIASEYQLHCFEYKKITKNERLSVLDSCKEILTDFDAIFGETLEKPIQMVSTLAFFVVSCENPNSCTIFLGFWLLW